MENSQGFVLVVLCVTFILFLLGREVVCWYWKINKAVDLLERIADRLDSTHGKQ